MCLFVGLRLGCILYLDWILSYSAALLGAATGSTKPPLSLFLDNKLNLFEATGKLTNKSISMHFIFTKLCLFTNQFFLLKAGCHRLLSPLTGIIAGLGYSAWTLGLGWGCLDELGYLPHT